MQQQIVARFVSLGAVATGLVLALAIVAAADADPPAAHRPRPDPEVPTDSKVRVESGPEGVTVYILVKQETPGSPGEGPSTAGSSSSGRQRSCGVDAMNIGNAALGWYKKEARKHPGATPWSVVCDDGFFAIVWIPIDRATGGGVRVVDAGSDPVDPAVVAQELLDELPVPDISIGANPSTGLVALASWFWLEGYGGEPITSSNTLLNVTVEVEVEPSAYRWTFGDGGSLMTTSLGRPYPAESDIQHVYEQSSLSAGGMFAVGVEATFEARYRVNGGPWQPLAPISRSFTTDYPVQQLQSVLTGR